MTVICLRACNMNHHVFVTLENCSVRNSLTLKDVSKCQNCGDRLVRANSRQLHFLEFGNNGGNECKK
jgi:hypothetical protein